MMYSRSIHASSRTVAMAALTLGLLVTVIDQHIVNRSRTRSSSQDQNPYWARTVLGPVALARLRTPASSSTERTIEWPHNRPTSLDDREHLPERGRADLGRVPVHWGA